MIIEKLEWTLCAKGSAPTSVEHGTPWSAVGANDNIAHTCKASGTRIGNALDGETLLMQRLLILKNSMISMQKKFERLGAGLRSSR